MRRFSIKRYARWQAREFEFEQAFRRGYAHGAREFGELLISRGVPVPSSLMDWVEDDLRRWVSDRDAPDTPPVCGVLIGSTDRDQWAVRLGMLKTKGFWIDNWGPKPGQPRCLVPPDLAAEFLKSNAAEMVA